MTYELPARPTLLCSLFWHSINQAVKTLLWAVVACSFSLYLLFFVCGYVEEITPHTYFDFQFLCSPVNRLYILSMWYILTHGYFECEVVTPADFPFCSGGNTTVWTKTGAQGNQWLRAVVSLPPATFPEDFRVRWN